MSRRTGFANLPLHPGRAPAWLFTRMTRLAREIATHIVADRGAEELLRRLSDPFWFQAFGCVLGFDWHSSGVTTTVTGALKEGLRGVEHELGIYSQGGKGATSRKTPWEITARCDRLAIDPGPLIYASRMAAKVDSAAVQDGYQLYHHAFFFSGAGQWCVVQQGMSDQTRTARRYHWLSESVTSFVNEPHEAICSDVRAPTLNLVAAEHGQIRNASVELAAASPDRVIDVVGRYGPGADARFHSFHSKRRRRPSLSWLRRRSRCRLVMRCSCRISIPGIFGPCCSARTNGHRRTSRRCSASKAWAGGRSVRWRSYPRSFTGRRRALATPRGLPSRTAARTGRRSPWIAPATTGRSTHCIARWLTRASIDRRRWMRSSGFTFAATEPPTSRTKTD